MIFFISRTTLDFGKCSGCLILEIKLLELLKLLVKILARRTMVEGEIWNTANNINQCNGFF